MAGRNKRGWRRVLVVVAALGLIAAAVGYLSLQSRMKEVRNLTIAPIDLSQVRDGVYEGEFDGLMVKARVRIKVSGHRITDFTILRHDTGRGQKAESIAEAVIEAQSLLVDAVSGATYSSKVILKAAERALRDGLID